MGGGDFHGHGGIGDVGVAFDKGADEGVEVHEAFVPVGDGVVRHLGHLDERARGIVAEWWSDDGVVVGGRVSPSGRSAEGVLGGTRTGIAIAIVAHVMESSVAAAVRCRCLWRRHVLSSRRRRRRQL